MTHRPRLHPSHLLIVARDGVLGQFQAHTAPHAASVALPVWQARPDALEAIALFCRSGWHVVVTASQQLDGGHVPGSPGTLDIAALNTLHSAMHQQLAAAGARVDAVFLRPATQSAAQHAAMLHDIACRYGMDIQRVHMLCHAPEDARVAAETGCVSHLLRPVETGIGQGAIHTLLPNYELIPPHTHLHDDILACAHTLLTPTTALPDHATPCTR